MATNRNNQFDITYNIRANTREAVQSFRQLSDTLKNTMNDANFGKGITRVFQSELQEANRVVGNLRSSI